MDVGRTKDTVFFFPRKSSWTIVSSKNLKSFFFPRSEKKNRPVFYFFQEKFISHSFKIWRGPTYFLTNRTVFFFLGIFWFFFSWQSSQCHFIHSISSFFFFLGPGKKNRFFIQSIHFTQKSSKNELCREKKNTVPLLYLKLNKIQ